MRKKYEDLYLRVPRAIFTFFGIWFGPKKIKILQASYMLFVMSTQYSFLIFEFIYISNVISDIDAASEASYLLFTQASLCYKTTMFILKKDTMAKLLDLMQSEVFAAQSIKHDEAHRVLAVRINRLCNYFLTSALVTTTLWGLIPLFDDAGNRSFPFRIWMPIGPELSPHYELGYIYQVLTIYISALLFCAVDSTAVCMIMFSCAQLDIIIDKMKRIRRTQWSFKFAPNDRQQVLEGNYKIIKECIQHHQAVVSFVDTVESTFHAHIFFQLAGSAFIICITGLRISIVEPHSVQFISMVTYMSTMLSQLFLYCWCGNELTIRGHELQDELYLCPWYQQDLKFNRSLWIAMERMKKPLVFYAGHYIPLSRKTFVSILRSSYSYFAVLNQAK